ncbi:MAG: signal recognition particle-docking protein FtsY [Bacilli bacterium]|nr:signal recognition particle-docking protein FtsY [Bacilli bacterium]
MGFFRDLKRIMTSDIKFGKDDQNYDRGLERTRNEMGVKLNNLSIKYKDINERYFEELEEILISADIGVNTVVKFMARLKDRIKKELIKNVEDLKEVIVDELFVIYVNEDVLQNKIKENLSGPTVILFVGVNGVGKTTTIGKMAHEFKVKGKKVMMIAGDTFRAGAVAQLMEWGERLNVAVVHKENCDDPSAVIHEGLVKAKKENYDYVLIDTAGRLQNKVSLMQELEKITRVIKNLVDGAPQETLLVIDATTGQNGISQARSFKEIASITGIVLTKLDGTAKGGIVLAIKDQINIPVKYVGLGEQEFDLEEFDIEKYIYGLFKDIV